LPAFIERLKRDVVKAAEKIGRRRDKEVERNKSR
jgi:hypothetical protein